MIQLRDDPIIRSIERTGFPPWGQDDSDELEDEDGDVYYGNETDSF